MSKFKVGDKVEIIDASQSCFENGDIGTIKIDDRSSCPYGVERKGSKDIQWYRAEQLKLIDSKPSKKQRIETLEKEVSELKLIVHELRERKETAVKIKSVTIGKPSTDISVEDKQADVIEFEGAQYRKVERKAREGDVVAFGDISTSITEGKLYKVILSESAKKESIVDDYGFKSRYIYFGSVFPNAVYELIEQTIVEDEPKTPNQLRAEVIEKAKLFVKNQISIGNCNVGEVVNGEHGHLTFKFYVNPKKHTVVFVGKNAYAGSHTQRGTTKCNPSDVFNEHIGKAIALGRALGLDVSEFEQAVQPTLAIGQEVYYKSPFMTNFEITTMINGFNGDGEPTNTYNGGTMTLEGITIINDTNAIYGGVE